MLREIIIAKNKACALLKHLKYPTRKNLWVNYGTNHMEYVIVPKAWLHEASVSGIIHWSLFHSDCQGESLHTIASLTIFKQKRPGVQNYVFPLAHKNVTGSS